MCRKHVSKEISPVVSVQLYVLSSFSYIRILSKIWSFLSSAGNMSPTLQPLNTGALNFWFSLKHVSHKRLLVHLHWSWGGVRHVTAGEVGDAHKLFKNVPTLRLKGLSRGKEAGDGCVVGFSWPNSSISVDLVHADGAVGPADLVGVDHTHGTIGCGDAMVRDVRGGVCEAFMEVGAIESVKANTGSNVQNNIALGRCCQLLQWEL